MTPRTEFPSKTDGSVDWLAVAKEQPEHFYVKGEHEATVAKLLSIEEKAVRNLVPELVAKVPDQYLVLRKAGIQRLAKLRGYDRYEPDVQHAERGYVVARVMIHWTHGPVTGAVGDASFENTSKTGSLYLGPMACNRAFALAVRNYLQIDIVSSDELGGAGTEPPAEPVSDMGDLSPQGTLEKVAKQCGRSWENVKAGGIKYRSELEPESDPEKWNSFADVAPKDCMTLIVRMRAAAAKA